MGRATPWKANWIGLRNRILSDARFQSFAARTPLLRRVARSRAGSLFDLIAGFAYSQTVSAAVESGMLDTMVEGPRSAGGIAAATGLGTAATSQLIRAAAALDLVEHAGEGHWMLGQQGAVLMAQPGALAMIRHHRLLYADLADPLALLAADRAQATRLSRFWSYARGDNADDSAAAEYSALMAASQDMVGREACAAYGFGRHAAVLDIGGGHGRFAARLVHRFPDLRVGVFDLPEVIEGTAEAIRNTPGKDRISLHPGNFFRDDLPSGYSCHALIRILHDHDDDRALRILEASRRALPPGGRLVIVEPMSEAPQARSVGAYFELYLWAMGSGRPRSQKEISAMLRTAGFSGSKRLILSQPTIASGIVGSA